MSDLLPTRSPATVVRLAGLRRHTDPMLEGRHDELQWLTDRVAALHDGEPFSAVLRGEPGAGKTALLRAVIADLPGVRVLLARGYEDEADIPFAGLVEIATPLLPFADQLPGVQRGALESALALAAPQPQDRLTVPAAVHGLLGLAAHEQPMLVIADDAQWLDPATRDALLFVARRLSAPAVGVVLAVRDDGTTASEFAGIEELRLGGLSDAAAARLLRTRAPDLPPHVAAAVLTAAAGNPLAVLELPTALTPSQRAGRALLDDPLLTTDVIDRAFSNQIAALPADAREAVLIAAAGGRATLDLLTAALRDRGLDASALAPAEQARIVTVTAAGTVEFRHPLLRANAYHAGTSAQQRAAHAALAAATDDPPRRAWHLAAAATGRDETIAAQLESAARDARARGGHAEAARAFSRAAELSVHPEAAGRRTLAAAQDAALAGAAGSALALLDVAAPLIEAERAPAVARLRGNLLMRRGEPLPARGVLESAARDAVGAGDHETAAALFLESSISYTMVGDPDGMYAVLDQAATAAAEAGGPTVFVTDAVRAVADVVTGATVRGRTALDTLEAQALDISTIGLAEPVGLLAQASLALGDLPRAARIIDAVVAEHREASALGGLPFPLSVRAMVHQRQGRLPQARVEAREAVEVAGESGQTLLLSFSLGTLAAVEASLGLVDDALVHAREGLGLAERARATNHLPYHHAAIGRALLAAGRLEQAADALDASAHWRMELGWREPGMLLDAADQLEVLVRLGRDDAVDTALGRLTAEAELTGNPWARAAVDRITLMTADLAEVDRLAAAALDWHAEDGMPFERARTLLAWGERLRRLRQRRQAREPLTEAHALFTELGAAPWATRAAEELAAAGGTGSGPAQPTPSDARSKLSAHELRIALMVSYGMTNREVGSALSLSPKTIEHHLSIIYRQLGIRSRTALARVLAEQRD